MAREVFGRDVDSAAGPGVAKGHDGGQEVVVGHPFERATREHFVEQNLDRVTVEVRSRRDEGLAQVERVVRERTRWPGLGALGSGHGDRGGCGSGQDRLGRCARRPARIHEAAHRAETLDCSVVIEAVARRGPGRGHDPVATLPRAEDRYGGAGSSGGLFDGVHGLYRIQPCQLLTTPIRGGKVSTDPRQPAVRCRDAGCRQQGALTCGI